MSRALTLFALVTPVRLGENMQLVLLVEDDDERAVNIEKCVPPQVRCVRARSAGAAIGILRRDKFAGILLDFDLYLSAHSNLQLTGKSVAHAICETQPRTCQIFVHSQNPAGAHRVFTLLKEAGFPVEQFPWSSQAIGPLTSWLRDLVD
jgi:hypothetical protein